MDIWINRKINPYNDYDIIESKFKKKTKIGFKF